VFAFRQLAIPLASLGQRAVTVNPHPGLDTRFPGVDLRQTPLDDAGACHLAGAHRPRDSRDRFGR
jgi:hypothetical protein